MDPGLGIWREGARRDGTKWTLPAYGYLESITILPTALIENMDASRPLHVVADLYDGDGNRVDIKVEIVCRSVVSK